ncbi:MAG: hypothetical protein K9N23_15725 [Akkermansiaceae bacterium]|nr:hypothetical protein [Akkermansiaceae bacterium]
MHSSKTPNSRRPPQKHFLDGLAVCLLGALALVCPGCINWADAPIMQRADTLAVANRAVFDAASPKSKLASAVYRLKMEGRGGYKVVSEQFLFRSGDGRLHHGTIDRAGKFIEHEAAFSKTLPENLAARLIRGDDAPLANATLVSEPWTFTDNGQKRFQFEFTLGERVGLCTTDSDGANRQVYFFVPDPQ